MTAQEADILLHRGKKLTIFDQPLRGYLDRLRRNRRPVFAATSTANWRGYVATWAFENNKLYLIGLTGRIRKGDDVIDASVETAFPWIKSRLQATWFSGILRCPEGQQTRYVHHGYASRYQRDRLFYIAKGHFEHEVLVMNPKEPVAYCISTDGERTRLKDVYWEYDIYPNPYTY